MDKFIQCCGAVLIAVILTLLIGKERKDLGLLLSAGACAMVAISALQYLRPVLQFISQLESLGNLDDSIVSVLLKVVGIGMLGEIAGLICTDSGNSALGKTLQYMSAAVIIWLSLPLFSMLMELLQRIMGTV